MEIKKTDIGIESKNRNVKKKKYKEELRKKLTIELELVCSVFDWKGELSE